MEYRHLGASGFKVPVLSFGTGTFGGKGDFFQAWGSTDVDEARRLIDICLDAGVTMFDTADIYSRGASESVLGEARFLLPTVRDSRVYAGRGIRAAHSPVNT